MAIRITTEETRRLHSDPIPRFIPVVILLCILYCWLLLPRQSYGAEPIVLGVIVNLEAKGDFFAYPGDAGDYFLRIDDLKAMGFREIPGTVEMIGNEAYVAMKSVSGVTSSYDARALTLSVTAPPSLLTRRTIDFTPQRQQVSPPPSETSGFFNYRTNYAGTSSGFTSFDLVNQLGLRMDSALFLADTIYTNTPSGDKFVRLMSSVTVDNRTTLQRQVYGDFFTTSGELGSTVIFGGASYGKTFKIDPYFITYPSITASGLVATPSDVDVYLDGMKLRTERVAPGEFELRNLYMTFGTGLVELVIKDAFGKEQRISLPYYLTDRLLKKDLHEYSYNLGFLRKDYGVKSNRYDTPALSAFHRYGRDDALTLGISGEASSDFLALAPQLTYLLGTVGLINVSLATSFGTASNGVASLLGYSYNTRSISSRLQIKSFSKDYATLDQTRDRKKSEINAGFGYGNPAFGSLSLGLSATATQSGLSQDLYTVSYSRRLTRKIDFFSTLRLIRDNNSEIRLFAGINYSLDTERQISSWIDAGNSSDKEILQLQKNTPVGEGYGYRASLERSATDNGSVFAVNPSLQYNGRYGIYTADLRGESGPGAATSYQIGAAGSLAYVGNRLTLSRPINDSFAIVKVGELEGVRVYQNAQEIGKTDAAGEIFVTDLNAYVDNQISINDKDIPIDHSLRTVVRHVSPPLRSGTCIIFPTEKHQPVTGQLHLRINDKIVPAEYAEVKLSIGGKNVLIPTGRGGEFYLDPGQTATADDLREPGCAALVTNNKATEALLVYRGSIDFLGNRYPLVLNVPKSDAVFIDLGTVIIDTASQPLLFP